ncbi:MAG: ASCH domain-containing protein [Chloroflexi bacterium]|nr:ASCH domain-containing protein [Chloroflexota bacterium]
MSDKIDTYWQQYLDILPESERNITYIAEGWGDSPEMATELGMLIAQGIKTATCSALWEWEAEGESPPEPGIKTIVLDGDDNPLCIVETTEVTIRPYNEVDAQFASDEGEGDRSLEYWRRVHWQFFTRSLAANGKEPALDMPLVCERFRVIYK